MDTGSGVLRHCSSVLEKAPNTTTGWRRVYVPAIAGVVVLLILLCLSPSFVREKASGPPSAMRVLMWALTAASLTAILTACGVFSRS